MPICHASVRRRLADGMRILSVLVAMIVMMHLCVKESELLGAPPRERKGNRDVDEDLDLPKPTRWGLLTCCFDGGRRITKVRIVLPKNKDAAWGKGIAGDQGLVHETTDPVTLRAIEAFLHWPLRLAVPEGLYGASGGAYPVGEIHVQTTKDRFLIGIEHGFALEDTTTHSQNTFFSWGLAKYIDDVLFKKTKLHISKDLFAMLSGESIISREKQQYEQMLKEKRKGKDKKQP